MVLLTASQACSLLGRTRHALSFDVTVNVHACALSSTTAAHVSQHPTRGMLTVAPLSPSIHQYPQYRLATTGVIVQTTSSASSPVTSL